MHVLVTFKTLALLFHFRSLADYYDIITSPIDLIKIQQKLKTDEYVDVNQFTADIELMVNNAKTYYKVIFFFFQIILSFK